MTTSITHDRGNSIPGNAYLDDIVTRLVQFSMLWAIVGMGVGVYIAAQLVWPALNFDLPWLSSDACGLCTPTV